MSKHIEVNNLNKRFGAHEAAKNVSFSIDKGQLVGLLGPSGGGKTTVLRMLAGLEFPDSGDIYIGGKRVNDLAPQKRGIGFVFQNYALFRHMTVFENIAFGLKLQKRKKQEIKDRVYELTELTGLKGLEKRMPHQLSGGQRQRVAFARALAPEPELLLLDEPFAAIDAKVRKQLRTWLKDMISRLQITSIFVTHDQEEAVEVADEIIIIQNGTLEQKGTPLDIYQSPQTAFVAGFIGESSVLADISGLSGFSSDLPGMKAMIRPEFVEVGREGELSLPSVAEKGIVREKIFRGTYWHLQIDVGGHQVVAHRPLERSAIEKNEEVSVLIHRLYFFNEQEAFMQENQNKKDPNPVYI